MNEGPWTKQEKELYMDAVRLHGRDAPKIAAHVGSKTLVAVSGNDEILVLFDNKALSSNPAQPRATKEELHRLRARFPVDALDNCPQMYRNRLGILGCKPGNESQRILAKVIY